jgi:putative ABC transport system substrate-binding protein
MQRREFNGLIGATALSFPKRGYAQIKADMPLVGLVLAQKPDTTIPNTKARIAALRKGLQEEGFIEGTNYSLAVRYAEGDLSRFQPLAMELGALNARVLVVPGVLYGLVECPDSNASRYCEMAHEFRRSFPELPIVFTAIAADLVALGVVPSYAHPGGMLTGNVMNAVGGEEAMSQKRIAFFKELVPNLKRLGMIGPTPAIGAVAMQ